MKFTVTFYFRVDDDEPWDSGYANFDTLEDAILNIEYMKNCDWYSYISGPLVPYEEHSSPNTLKTNV